MCLTCRRSGIRADRPVTFHQPITSISGRDVQAIFFRRRHQARRPPLAKIRPGRPAPAMGPGTGVATRLSKKMLLGKFGLPPMKVADRIGTAALNERVATSFGKAAEAG